MSWMHCQSVLITDAPLILLMLALLWLCSSSNWVLLQCYLSLSLGIQTFIEFIKSMLKQSNFLVKGVLTIRPQLHLLKHFEYVSYFVYCISPVSLVMCIKLHILCSDCIISQCFTAVQYVHSVQYSCTKWNKNKTRLLYVFSLHQTFLCRLWPGSCGNLVLKRR